MLHRRYFAFAVLGLLASPALSQERAPPERQTLLDLAYTLGESHALRQVCAGEGDQFWRDRMVRLTETEAADAAFDGRLKQAFNSGFATRQTEFPSCGPASRKAEAAVAAKGQNLAAQLSQVTRVVRNMGSDTPTPESDGAAPDSVANTGTPR